ncbi:LAQU0S05e01838g1_1 [Lachancea quebecensis]|uniref:LAQU0S05e01838g1_1 n=1 Tax=Lachancea quebecensis TaxID=1654605 RepID=A0A0P1KRB2_9SACH|nr:LAQU0S05e01838g1_1 [Lachancea quebecensis]
MTTYVKLVKGATKIKMAPPKAKYVDPILLGTAEPHEFREIMHALDARVQDTAWTIVYKSLIVVHLMIREGEPLVTIKYLSKNQDFFSLKDIFHSKLSSGDLQALRRYRDYLRTRCEEYANTGKDYVRENNSSLTASAASDPKLSLSHVESLEAQISALIKNRYSQYDLGNDLLLTAFRLLVQDLLVLYNSLNEGIITLLESFFELTHQDAERTLKLYKRFVELTESVVKYLKTGKAVGLKIPVIKHITTKLIRSLEEHLKEDNSNHGQNFSSTDSKTPAQRELEQIREQKRQLEEQMKTQQQMVISPTIPQQQTGYNPFAEGFSFEQPATTQPITTQPTSNPFMAQAQLPQQTGQPLQYQQTQQAVQPLQYQQTQQVVQPLQYQQTQQAPTIGQLQQVSTTGQFQQPSVTGQFQASQQMPQQMSQADQYQQAQLQQQQQQQQQQQAQIPQQTPQAFQYQHTQAHQQASPGDHFQPFQPPASQTTQPSPHLQSAPTGFFSSNTQVTPSFTGAGFGGYYSPEAGAGVASGPGPAQAPVQVATPTGSNNPFSMENIARSKDERERVNPFSQTNQSPALNSSAAANPFDKPMQNPHTFGGLENMPTVSVFPQTRSHTTQLQQAQIQPQHTQLQFQQPQQAYGHPQQSPMDPYTQAQQNLQQQQQYGNLQYSRPGEGPNLIDI